MAESKRRKGPQVVKFEAVDKRLIKGKVKHTRTGACTARGRCNHGRKR
jgi:hypothetical protein